MQEAEFEDYASTRRALKTQAPRLLVGANEVDLKLTFNGEDLAHVLGSYTCELLEKDGYSWIEHRVQELLFCRVAVLRILQGASIQQTIGPGYLLVKGDIRPIFHPRFGIENALLLEVLDVPEEGDISVVLSMAYAGEGAPPTQVRAGSGSPG